MLVQIDKTSSCNHHFGSYFLYIVKENSQTISVFQEDRLWQIGIPLCNTLQKVDWLILILISTELISAIIMFYIFIDISWHLQDDKEIDSSSLV